MDRRGPPDHDRRRRRRAAADYPVVERDDAALRAYKDDVLAHLGNPLIDVRSPEEYNGDAHHRARLPGGGRAARRPHPDRAERAVGAGAVAEDGTLQDRAPSSTPSTATRPGSKDGDDVIAYCRIGERSSHTWFVLTHLLGFEDVRNYDGSWTEWGSAVRVPIVTGAEPGECRSR